MTTPVRYAQTYRRTLLDMHIPDWDPSFLSEFDPEKLAELYANSKVTGALFYTKSHMGLNYWPSPVGGIHPAAADRDLVGELYQALRARGIAPAAYYSVIFDNWAIERNPEWAIVPATTLKGFDFHLIGPRYGTACANNADYRAYERSQIIALLERYDFDAFWIDMAFWTAICICQRCAARYRDEAGEEIPVVVDWSSPTWARFQTARERWLEELTVELIDTAHSVRPEMAVTHNLAPGTIGWMTGQKLDWCRYDSFAAGDIYGGKEEQLLVSRLMLHLGKNQPPEFMTSRTLHLLSHTALKSEHRMLVEALAATAHASSFLFIDAIDPQGTVNLGVYDRIGRVFAQTSRYEHLLGGTPVEDVAIYYSDDSRVSPADNGRSMADVSTETFTRVSPHLKAVSGAVRQLQAEHVPFGVLTRSQLDRLGGYRLLVLPEVLRMDDAEIEAVRSFVAGGGAVYASGRTSLLGTDGAERPDFGLADVFGAHVEGFEEGMGVYSRALDQEIAQALVPETHIGHGFPTELAELANLSQLAMPRLAPGQEGRALAALTLPFGYPSPGVMAAHDFASIHSSPPWEDRENPTIVSNRFGKGQAVYAALPLETGRTEGEGRVFAQIVRTLLGEPPTVTVQAHPDVWVTVFEQPENRRAVVSVLGYFIEARPTPFPVKFSYACPAGRRCARVCEALSGTEVPFELGESGRIDIMFEAVDLFGMYLVEYD